MRKNKVIYQLSIEDIQTVAEEMLDRKLNAEELNRAIDKVSDHIPWYDAIYNTFLELGIKHLEVNDSNKLEL